MAHYVKKLKPFQRSDLLPLYHDHATYLLRSLKTLIEKDDFDIESFYDQIDSFIESAMCHEVAINSMSRKIDIATHQNPKGKEKEYTNHPSSEKVGVI